MRTEDRGQASQRYSERGWLQGKGRRLTHQRITYDGMSLAMTRKKRGRPRVGTGHTKRERERRKRKGIGCPKGPSREASGARKKKQEVQPRERKRSREKRFRKGVDNTAPDHGGGENVKGAAGRGGGLVRATAKGDSLGKNTGRKRAQNVEKPPT